MVLDGLDGRVARLTHTQSAFGAEYDSLADMVCFGAAPALVMYEWVLRDLGKLGWIAAFVYVAGAALRLARFNTHARGRRQALVHGAAEPVGRGAGRRASCGSSTTYGYRSGSRALVGVVRHAVRRASRW